MMASSIYRALDRDRWEVRPIIRLPPVDRSALIECTLREASLEESPAYIKLSYAWGEPKITAHILVNGVRCQVTTNLESAFRYIRHGVDHLGRCDLYQPNGYAGVESSGAANTANILEC